VVDEAVLGQIFSEYFGFSFQFSLHRLLHTHHLSSGAGAIVAEVPRGLSVTHIKKLPKNCNNSWTSRCCYIFSSIDGTFCIRYPKQFSLSLLALCLILCINHVAFKFFFRFCFVSINCSVHVIIFCREGNPGGGELEEKELNKPSVSNFSFALLARFHLDPPVVCSEVVPVQLTSPIRHTIPIIH
jgi:hypothetical protein